MTGIGEIGGQWSPAVICSERPELGSSDYIVLMYARDTTTGQNKDSGIRLGSEISWD